MRIAIFHMEEIPTLFLLQRAAKKVGFTPHLFHLRDMRFFLDENGCDVKVGDVSLKDFSLIFVRGFWQYQTELAHLAEFCTQQKIPLFDSALLHNQTISKTYDMMIFKKHKFPLIPTIFLENEDAMPAIQKAFSFPVIAKENRGKRGLDVHLLKNTRQLGEFLTQMIPADKTLNTKTYQFQEFIPADYDIRVLVLGWRVLGAIERRSADPHDFRHNISLGGRAKKIHISREIHELAIKAARALDYEFAGVDFIIHKKTGKLYLLEVNRSPGFEGFMQATGIDVPLELMKFFLAFCLKAHTMRGTTTAPLRSRYGASLKNRNSFADNRPRQARS